MKVFLSWAGEASKHMATTLYTWLPQVIYTLKPWMSTRIDKGDSWDGAISEALHESPIAIFCLTADSLDSKYLHYEAGAIANTKGSKPCTLLLGITDLDVKHPLARFQHTKFTKEDMLVLLQTINTKMQEAGETAIPEAVLSKALDHNWPELESASQSVPMSKVLSTSRPQKDLLEEILETVRMLALRDKHLDQPTRFTTLTDSQKNSNNIYAGAGVVFSGIRNDEDTVTNLNIRQLLSREIQEWANVSGVNAHGLMLLVDDLTEKLQQKYPNVSITRKMVKDTILILQSI